MIRVTIILFLGILFFSCRHEKDPVVKNTGYPEEIENIIVTKCATDGCHNSASRHSASGLDFSTWDLMFEGGKNGSSVIPFSVSHSYLLFSTNTDSTRAPVLLPTMPYLQAPLTETEYQTIKNWIANGAPNKNGEIKFSGNPDRRKAYICMQGCDKVAIVDAETKIIMRYLEVGNIPNVIEGPHQIKISPDGQYWYPIFVNGNILQKYRTSDDQLVGTVELDAISHSWNTMIITPDGKKGFVNALDGRTAIVDLESMINELPLPVHSTPHGGFITADGRYLYLTCQNGNFFYKIDLNSAPFYDEEEKISLVPGVPPSDFGNEKPHEMALSPDGSRYFVTCQGTNEVRVFSSANDSLIDVIPVGTFPQEIAFSENEPYAFITCTEDPVSPGKKGSVYVIHTHHLAILSSLHTGYQPHGIAVDDVEDLVYITNLNFDTNGPIPHHTSECGGRNGNLTIIDMNTLQLYNRKLSDGVFYQFKTELLNFPYFVSIKD